MKKPGELLTKYRNAFLVGLLIATLLISSNVGRHDKPAIVSIPVVETAAIPISALESFRQQRDQSASADIAALEKLCAQDTLDEQTRQDAADQLRTLIDARQAQTALEGTLAGSSLYPCVAVVQGGSLTIVTEKTSITEKDSALVLTLAAAHTGVAAENVRIVSAND